MNVCIFLPTGKTFSFKKVKVLVNNESFLILEYVAMSDGIDKAVTFQKSAIVGWSFHEEVM